MQFQRSPPPFMVGHLDHKLPQKVQIGIFEGKHACVVGSLQNTEESLPSAPSCGKQPPYVRRREENARKAMTTDRELLNNKLT